MADVKAAGIDLGTMWIVSARDGEDGKVKITDERNCFRSIPFVEEYEEHLKAQGGHYIKDGNNLYLLGSQAFVMAGMAEVGSELKNGGEVLQRPMKDGILNPESPKIALTVLRELMKGCIEKGIGPARPGEILYFSVPANPVDSPINNSFHAKMAERYLNGLSYDARPINEALACLFSENPKMHTPEGDVPFTGISMSFGAGMTNFCLAERGVPLDEFSICRAGDFIDQQVARMTGQPKTKILRVKEKKLNFNNIDESDPDGDILLALDVYYDDLVQYVFNLFSKRFSGNKGTIEYPIDIVLCGGTASPSGFDKKIKKFINKMSLPFEIAEVRLAGGGDRQKMLKAVANGCWIRARQAAKKMNASKDVLNELDGIA